jgi:hypothetical protein
VQLVLAAVNVHLCTRTWAFIYVPIGGHALMYTNVYVQTRLCTLTWACGSLGCAGAPAAAAHTHVSTAESPGVCV